MTNNMPRPSTFWNEAAAKMTPEEMNEAVGEWEAHKLGDNLSEGILVRTARECLQERGISMKNYGRVEAAKTLLDAITMRAFHELQSARPVIEASTKLVLGELEWNQTEEDLLEDPELAVKEDGNENMRQLSFAVTDHLRRLKESDPEASLENAGAHPAL